MAAPRRDLPHGLDQPLTDGDELIPAVHQNVLLATVQQERIANVERRSAIRPQHDVLIVERLRP